MVWKIFSLGSLAWDLWFVLFGWGTLIAQFVKSENLVSNLWLEIFGLGSLVWGTEVGELGF